MKHVYISPLGMQDPWSGWNPQEDKHKPFNGTLGSSLALLSKTILDLGRIQVKNDLEQFKIVLLVSDEIQNNGGLLAYQSLVETEFPQLNWDTHFEVNSISGKNVHLEATIRDDVTKV
jgi:hypothetical protein